jgi:peptidoglycan L-alanyl-D-glutamate endopeptidase CwlK
MTTRSKRKRKPSEPRRDNSISSLKPEMAFALGHLEVLIEQAGLRMKRFETYRGVKRQAFLYAKGRTAEGRIVTMAQPNESPHNFGLAADYVFLTGGGQPTWEGPWDKFTALVKKIGLISGGSWHDFAHIQMPDWKSKK